MRFRKSHAAGHDVEAQLFKSSCVIRIAGQQVAKCPPPGVGLPGVTGNLTGGHDVSHFFWCSVGQVINHDRVDVDRQLIRFPILAHFSHAFGIPDRAE